MVNARRSSGEFGDMVLNADKENEDENLLPSVKKGKCYSKCLRVPLGIVDWISETFDNDFEIKNDITTIKREFSVLIRLTFPPQVFFQPCLCSKEFFDILKLLSFLISQYILIFLTCRAITAMPMKSQNI